MDLVGQLDDVARTDCRIAFLDDGDTTPFGAIWDRAATSASALYDRSSGGTVAMLLDTSPDCIAALLGAFRAGLRVLSLPLPPRGGRADWYADYILRVCASADVRLLVLERQHLDLVPGRASFESVAFDDLRVRGVGLGTHRAGAELVQFTSGSTAEPSGVVLTTDEIASNIDAMLSVLEPAPGDVSVSWLPLSHDMGLIGMLLTALVATHPARAGGGTVGLMRPTTFARTPWRWLQACSELNATFTSAPDFALQLATLTSDRAGPIDISSLRACIVGGEPVHRSTLDSFCSAFEARRFSPLSFCPAYGLAEAALAVSMTPPSTPWRTTTLDHGALEEGRVVVRDSGRQLVAAGRPLPGYSVQIEGDSAVGRIALDGPSISRHSLADGKRVGPLRTNDLGFFHDDQLYVLGRLDDVLNISGRKVWLVDVDAAIESTGLVRPGRGFGAIDKGGELVAAAELDDSAAPEVAVHAIARAIANRVGVTPAVVALFERSTLPRTTSGKPRRSAIAAEIETPGPSTLHITSF